jgi:hypothetical protein
MAAGVLVIHTDDTHGANLGSFLRLKVAALAMDHLWWPSSQLHSAQFATEFYLFILFYFIFFFLISWMYYG